MGLEHIRSGRFFEAHEELEIAWRAAAPEERDFYQGLVHVAVAWYQDGRGRPIATARQLEKALRRLEAYEPTHRGVDVAALRRQLAELRETLFPAGEPARPESGADERRLRGRQPDGIEGAIDGDVEPPVSVEEEQ
jgi:predicted metal-dependent hydrolase